MVAPVDREYYLMMKNRIALEYRFDRYDFFYTETRLLLGRLFRLSYECENKVEIWRRKLTGMVRFSTRGIFDKIDSLRRNYLTKEDVKNFIYFLVFRLFLKT